MNGWARRGLLLLLLGSPAVRAWLESRMSLHMAVELPLLMLSGWILAGAAPARWKLLARMDAEGLLCATIAACVLAMWMVPAALDMAIMEPGVGLLKYVQWISAGALLRGARDRHSPVVAAFFLLNAAWMTATAGLLYLDAEQQLCVNYLIDDQQAAGFALMAWGVALAAFAWKVLKPLFSPRVDGQSLQLGQQPSTRSRNTEGRAANGDKAETTMTVFSPSAQPNGDERLAGLPAEAD